MRVLVTGGAGYVGAAVVAALAARPDVDEVVVYDNLSRGVRALFVGPRLTTTPGQVRLLCADILDTRTLGRALDGMDLVLHLAGRVTTPFANDDAHGFDQVNRWGTSELAHLVEISEAPVNRIVYLSSAAIYGNTIQPADVTADAAPITAYGASKWAGERSLARLRERVDVCIVRCANVHGFGTAMRFDAGANRMLFDAHFTGLLTIQGSGEERRSLVHVETVVRTLLAIGSGDCGQGVFHLVDRVATVNEIADGVCTVVPGTGRIHIGRHLKLPDSAIQPDPRVPASLLEHRDLPAVLAETRRQFSF